MNKKSNKNKLKHYLNKLKSVYDLYDSKDLEISFDRLQKEKKVEYELLYFKCSNKERKGIFVFSYPFFLKELRDQGLKKILGHNVLNFRIHNAYRKLSKKDGDMVKINEILNLMYNNDNSIQRGRVLSRILSLAYYHGWDFKKIDDGVDIDYKIAIPKTFREKLKQRFNVDIYQTLIDDRKVTFFINMKGDLVFVFKLLTEFTKLDIEEKLIPYLNDEFKIKKITL